MPERSQVHVAQWVSMLALLLPACGTDSGSATNDRALADGSVGVHGSGGTGGSSGLSNGGASGMSTTDAAIGRGGGDAAAGTVDATAGRSGDVADARSAADSGGGGAPDTGSADTRGGGPILGAVTFVPYYETGSEWESNPRARAMVAGVFAEVGAALRTSGTWNATIEVYLTDDSTGFANTFFDAGFTPVMLDGQSLLAAPAWREIVLGEEDANGPANNAGKGYEFGISFNVKNQAGNAGLLRHEMMHGLGAVNIVPGPLMSSTNQLSRLVAGDWYRAGVYDLSLRDRTAPLLGSYDKNRQMFQIAPFKVDATFVEWTDGTAGLFFRGIADNGAPLDMALATTPAGDGARLQLNEPENLMSAASHPNWNHLAEPDRAFFRAMRYQLAK